MGGKGHGLEPKLGLCYVNITQMKQIKVKGKDVWDDSDRLEFLESMVNEQIIPNLPAVTITPTAPIETAPAAASDVEEMELDDNGEPLPF